MFLQLAFSLIQFLLVPLTLAVLLMFKVLSNIWGKGEDIPLRHAQAAVADLVAVKFMVWLILFYLGGRYLWPTAQRQTSRFQTITLVAVTTVALTLSLTHHYVFTNTLSDYLQKNQNTWGSMRSAAYREMLDRSPLWSFLMPIGYLTLNLSVRRFADRCHRQGLPPTDA